MDEEFVRENRVRILVLFNKNLIEKIDRIVNEGHDFSNRQEFIREGVRRLVEKHKLEDML